MLINRGITKDVLIAGDVISGEGFSFEDVLAKRKV
jgi:hypothetical protein